MNGYKYTTFVGGVHQEDGSFFPIFHAITSGKDSNTVSLIIETVEAWAGQKTTAWVADNDLALERAICEGGHLYVRCWFHVQQCIMKYMTTSRFPSEEIEEFRVLALKLHMTKSEFNMRSALRDIQRWCAHTPKRAKFYKNYFFPQWAKNDEVLEQWCLWGYRCVAEHHTTNNGLERYNRYLKEQIGQNKATYHLADEVKLLTLADESKSLERLSFLMRTRKQVRKHAKGFAALAKECIERRDTRELPYKVGFSPRDGNSRQTVSLFSMICSCISFRTQSCNQHPWCKHIQACKDVYTDEVFNQMCATLRVVEVQTGPDAWFDVHAPDATLVKTMPQFAWCSCNYMERCMGSLFRRALCPHICAVRLQSMPPGSKGTDVLEADAAAFKAVMGDYCLDNVPLDQGSDEDSEGEDEETVEREEETRVDPFIKIEPGPSYLCQEHTSRPQKLVGCYSRDGFAKKNKQKRTCDNQDSVPDSNKKLKA